MLRRALATASLAALAISAASHEAAASTRHAGSIAAHEPSLSIGTGRGLGAPNAIAPAHPVLTIPAPSAIQEHRKALENAPSTSTAPAVKPSRDPFPDFNVPLRRHRMAMPDSAISGLGDLSF